MDHESKKKQGGVPAQQNRWYIEGGQAKKMMLRRQPSTMGYCCITVK